MLLGGTDGVVREVINDEGVAVGGEVDVELEEEGVQAGRCGRIRGERKQNVALILCEVKENLGRQGGAEGLELGGKDEKVVVGALAMLKKGRVGFGRCEGEVEAAGLWVLLAKKLRIAIAVVGYT